MSNQKQTTLSTQGYRGTRDFFPEDQRLRRWLFDKMHSVLSSFGYEEYGGPFLEPLELYANKTSEEIVREQLYHLTDRGERQLAIRPEMTPTLARMVAAKVNELPKPIRWYSIPTCMRYERPQRGRLREFDQLNVDVFGGVGVDEDVEIILTAVALMEGLGARTDMFEVHLNHRGLVNDLFAKIQIDESKRADLLRLLDKKDKLPADVFVSECEKQGLDKTQISHIENFLNCDVESLKSILGSDNPNVMNIAERVHLLKELVPGNCIQFKPDVMRGFDYYTGLVFEIFDVNPENRRALFGGGRYDNLLSAFGVPPMAGIGYGAGDVALLNFMESNGLTPKLARPIDVSVLRFSENDRKHAFLLAQKMRECGLNVDAPLTASKFGKQIQAAEKAGAKAVAFCGEEEIKNQSFSVKWLKTGEQQTFPLSEVKNFTQILKN